MNVDGPREQLAQAYRDLSGMFVSSLPRLATAIVIIVALVAFAKLAEVVLRVVLRRIHVDQMFARAGLDRTLRRLGIERPASVLLPRLVFVLLLFLFAQTAADLLGLVAISAAIQSFFGYLPNIIAAVLLLVMGSIVAQFAGRTVARAAADSGIDFADSLGSVVSGVILFVIGIMAVAQLRIDTEMVRLITAGVLAALAIAFGLSFGLGSRDITRNIIAGFYARKIFHPGDAIEIRGERGVLRAITPIQTIIERDNVVIAVSNATFLDETVKQ